MKLRVIATFFAVIALSVSSVSAQNIGIFGDPGGATCNVTSALGGAPGTAWVIAQGLAGITGAEYRIDMPATYLAVVTPNSASNVNNGSPVMGGTNEAFPVCQPGDVILATVTIVNIGDFVGDITLVVEKHTTPSNPFFQCPLITLCDAPAFTKVCTTGGSLFLNSPRNCTVAVEQSSWSEVKNLYSN